jgi:hypothetical protein
MLDAVQVERSFPLAEASGYKMLDVKQPFFLSNQESKALIIKYFYLGLKLSQ